MKPTNKISVWTGSFILIFTLSILILSAIPSTLGIIIYRDLSANLSELIKWSFINATICLLIFAIIKRLNFVKSHIFVYLLPVSLGTIVFVVFGWFYFPHYNNKGYTACEELGQTKGEAETMLSAGEYYNLTKVSERIDNFIRLNGKPTSIEELNGRKYYQYEDSHSSSCTLHINQSGVIESIFICSGVCL
jgi:hypothetical protein